MQYDTVILELLQRVQKLEEEVAELKTLKNSEKKQKKLTTADIREYIAEKLEKKRKKGEAYLTVCARDVHKALPLKNAMPMVCNAMYSLMKDGDEILEKSPSGYSSTLTIRYALEKRVK